MAALFNEDSFGINAANAAAQAAVVAKMVAAEATLSALAITEQAHRAPNLLATKTTNQGDNPGKGAGL